MIAATKNISSTDTHTTAIRAPRVLIAAGGTGGHVYPGIAIADALRKLNPDSEILFAGTRDRMEWESVPKAGYEIKSIWISGLHRRLTVQNLLFPLKLATGILQSIYIIRQYKPDVVVSCGGFASGPIGWVAAKMGIPLLLQEQNSYPGITTRLLAKHAKQIFTAFEDAADHLPPEKIALSGNPTRSGIESAARSEALGYFGFQDSRPVLLVIGGSGGAKTVNDSLLNHLHELHDEAGIQIIWQCGRRYYRDLSEQIDTEKLKGLRLVEFIENMPAAYAAASLVVSRAGALSCSELMMTGKPSILIPSAHVAGDHQTKNAAAMVRRNAAVLLKDEEAVQKLAGTVKSLILDQEKLEKMSREARALAKPGAAEQIARRIEKISKRNHEE